MKKTLYDILIIVLLIAAIIQTPLFYYYTFGLIRYIFLLLYSLIGLVITIWLITVLFRNDDETGTRSQRTGILIVFIVGCFSLFFGESSLEKIDWHLRKETRNEIVELIKTDKLKTDIPRKYKLKKWASPPISNGGNEVIADKTSAGKITVKFYTDRGFIDHYAAFIYTDNPADVEIFEKEIIKGKRRVKKLDTNWYSVSY